MLKGLISGIINLCCIVTALFFSDRAVARHEYPLIFTLDGFDVQLPDSLVIRDEAQTFDSSSRFGKQVSVTYTINETPYFKSTSTKKFFEGERHTIPLTLKFTPKLLVADISERISQHSSDFMYTYMQYPYSENKLNSSLTNVFTHRKEVLSVIYWDEYHDISYDDVTLYQLDKEQNHQDFPLKTFRNKFSSLIELVKARKEYQFLLKEIVVHDGLGKPENGQNAFLYLKFPEDESLVQLMPYNGRYYIMLEKQPMRGLIRCDLILTQANTPLPSEYRRTLDTRQCIDSDTIFTHNFLLNEQQFQISVATPPQNETSALEQYWLIQDHISFSNSEKHIQDLPNMILANRQDPYSSSKNTIVYFNKKQLEQQSSYNLIKTRIKGNKLKLIGVYPDLVFQPNTHETSSKNIGLSANFAHQSDIYAYKHLEKFINGGNYSIKAKFDLASRTQKHIKLKPMDFPVTVDYKNYRGGTINSVLFFDSKAQTTHRETVENQARNLVQHLDYHASENISHSKNTNPPENIFISGIESDYHNHKGDFSCNFYKFIDYLSTRDEEQEFLVYLSNKSLNNCKLKIAKNYRFKRLYLNIYTENPVESLNEENVLQLKHKKTRKKLNSIGFNYIDFEVFPLYRPVKSLDFRNLRISE